MDGRDVTQALAALPLAAAAEGLRALLCARASAQTGSSRRISPPVVVPLGDADVLDPGQDAIAEARRQAMVHLTPNSVLIGPWGTWPPGDQRGCGQCLAIRWQQLRPDVQREALEYATRSHPAGQWPLLTPFLADAVWQLYRAVVLGTRPPGPAGRLVCALDTRTLLARTVPLVAESSCPACADPADGPSAPQLTSRSKPAPDTYRARQPASYPINADAFANPVCGVLGRRAAPLLNSPTTAPVAGHLMCHSVRGLKEMTWGGMADRYRDSRALALIEGLERYASARPRGPGGVVTGSYDELRDDAIDPRLLGDYPPETYQADPLTAPFDPGREIAWARGYSLTRDRPVLVPLQLVYYYAGQNRGTNFAYESSNGHASGASVEEAALFGVLELVERDAFLLGWYGGAELTEIDLATTSDARLRRMIDRADFLGYEVRAFDNRIDLDIPVVTGIAVRRDGGEGYLAFASGASLDPGAACTAALAEILTHIPSLPALMRGRRDELRAMAADFYQVAQLRDHAAVFGLPEMAVHARRYLERRDARPIKEVYAGWPERRPATRDFLDDLRFCQGELERAGLEVILVDQTFREQHGTGLHTVCVIVPGLLPIDFGWGRQRALRMPRMRTALRRAGMRSTDLCESQLHLVPHPFP